MAYAPDGATLATGGGDRTVRIWDARTGQQQHEFAGHTGWVLAVAYAPDGATLATGGDDRTVRIWDARTGQQQQLAGRRVAQPGQQLGRGTAAAVSVLDQERGHPLLAQVAGCGGGRG